MQEEIFGPILPVLEVDNVQQVIDFVNARPSPLGLYVFAEDQHVAERILDSTTSGDAAVNDCTIQPLIPDLPFGGVGRLRDGQVPRRVGLPHLHKYPRRPVSRRAGRPRSALPAVQPSEAGGRTGRFVAA